MRQIKSYSPQEKEDIINKYNELRKSGLSQSASSKQLDIALSTLRQWLGIDPSHRIRKYKVKPKVLPQLTHIQIAQPEVDSKLVVSLLESSLMNLKIALEQIKK